MSTPAAKRLFDAHERRERFAPLPPELAPRSASEAYAIQDGFVALRAEKLGARAGYKIALTSEEMRRFVGVDSPQAGVMFASTVRRSPARINASDYVRLIVEFEIALLLTDDAARFGNGNAASISRVTVCVMFEVVASTASAAALTCTVSV